MRLSFATLLAALLGLLPVGAGAVFKLEVSPASYRFGDFEGGGSTTATFDIRVTDLPVGEAIAAYDFGLIYDPTLMQLAGFSGFSGLLGDPDLDQVVNQDHTDLAWNYQTDAGAPGLGSYAGVSPGTPYQTSGGYYEGSLRFSQASFLCYENDANGCNPFPGDPDLLTLQDHTTPATYTLFSLSFDVDTTQHKVQTPVLFVTDADYAGFTTPPSAALLDFKVASPTDPDGLTPQYPQQGTGIVAVPLPAPLALLVTGLAVIALGRQRRRAPRSIRHDQ